MAPSSLIQMKKNGADIDLLNPQQQMFVEHLMADKEFNGARAAREAGYKPSHARAANRLLNMPAIQKAIGKGLTNRARTVQLDAARVLRELACIGFANPKDMFSPDGRLLGIHEMPDEITRAISGFDVESVTSTDKEGVETTVTLVKPRFWNKNNALELIAKHLGMLDERFKVGLEGNVADLIGTLLQRIEQTRDNVVDAKFIEASIDEET